MTTPAGPVPSRFVFVALYAAAFLVLVDQVGELVVGLYPFETGSPQWRFGAFGLIAGRTTILVLVDAMLLIAALGREHLVLIRIWAVVHLLLGALALVGLAMFGLDAVEIRTRVRPEGETAFALATIRVAGMTLLSAIFCLWAGVAAFRSVRKLRRDEKRDPVLVSTRNAR